jgi:hypothetical protein
MAEMTDMLFVLAQANCQFLETRDDFCRIGILEGRKSGPISRVTVLSNRRGQRLEHFLATGPSSHENRGAQQGATRSQAR